MTHILQTHWDRVAHKGIGKFIIIGFCVFFIKKIIIGSYNGLTGAEPLFEHTLEYCYLDPLEHS